MPRCGSQVYLCDLPISFDNYRGCSHGCKYCFASNKNKTMLDIEKDEELLQIKKFVEGKRNRTTNWCDWDIPLHWGGMSDPFQPIEKQIGSTKKILEYLAETQYPIVISTKGRLLVDEEYLSLLEKCNCVIQISMACSKYDILEPGTPKFEERLEMLSKVSKRVKRTIVRVQPYMCEVKQDVKKNLKRFKEAGAYGVIIEGMKFKKKKNGLIKIGGDFCYPYQRILNDFLDLKKEAHEVGLKIYAGENRIRKYGDSLTCCGIDGLEGFVPNTYNLNHILNGDKVMPTKNMEKEDTAMCFQSILQTGASSRGLKNKKFADEMIRQYKLHKNSIDKAMGVEKL